MTATEIRDELLVDRFASRYDFMQTRHLVVAAPADRAYLALRRLDFMEVGGRLVSASFWVRGLPERWRNRRRPPRVPTRLTLDDMTADSDWVFLGERPGAEVAAGAVGRFWKPVIEWRHTEAGEFTAFDEPGYGKIVFSLSATPYGQSRSLLTYDVRIVCTDRASRARVRAYWSVVAPFVGAVQTATLRTAARHAEQPG
ncbi:hypothetical protein [Amycolatopsis alkalitolerans]|uniref:DUF2867 domain-containing protein n=1 Tax=Amycolatopsis alkalitolerans TaxID=2547244 RepID=A0A5C4LYR6_9PSEU|nr:hypothetical protein [Amycolatopsis alkalitolerans]TNC24819.1 hypothetical protein FG385_16355 [Amycolatopsis alkalitolerans]